MTKNAESLCVLLGISLNDSYLEVRSLKGYSFNLFGKDFEDRQKGVEEKEPQED